MNDAENWKGTLEKSGGGVLIDSGTHIVDLLLMFFGKVESVAAMGERLPCTAGNKAEDTAILSMKFASGVVMAAYESMRDGRRVVVARETR